MFEIFFTRKRSQKIKDELVLDKDEGNFQDL